MPVYSPLSRYHNNHMFRALSLLHRSFVELDPDDGLHARFWAIPELSSFPPFPHVLKEGKRD